MREPNNTRQYALDIYWKSLQKKDNWFMILPPTVSQYENYSDIEKKNTNYHWLMLDIEKKWLNQRRN
jgi:predicted RNA-binding protein